MGKSKRDTYKYLLIRNGKRIYAGITTDPERRERQHNQNRRVKVRLRVEGRAATEEAARNWEAEQKAKGIPTGG